MEAQAYNSSTQEDPKFKGREQRRGKEVKWRGKGQDFSLQNTKKGKWPRNLKKNYFCFGSQHYRMI